MRGALPALGRRCLTKRCLLIYNMCNVKYGCGRRVMAKRTLAVQQKRYNQLSVVYCRENARESRFRNQRGKICPKFAYIHNLLAVNLLAANIAILRLKCIC